MMLRPRAPLAGEGIAAAAASHDPGHRLLGIVAESAAVVTVAVGVVEMVAWLARLDAVLNWPGKSPPMVFNTALCLVIAGAGLYAASRNWHRAVPGVAGASAVAIGLLALLEYAVGSLGIDEVFVSAHVAEAGGHPGRLAPNTALCFLLIGLALLTIAWPRLPGSTTVVTVSGTAGGAIALLALAGQATETAWAYRWARAASMALETSTVMLVLVVGLLALAARDFGLQRNRLPFVIGAAALVVGATTWAALARGVERGASQDTGAATRASVALAILMAVLVTAVLWSAVRAERGRRLAEELSARSAEAERVQAEAAGYARSLIEASLDPLVTISADGEITDVNESTVRATGVPREQLVGTDFSEYFTDPDKAREGYRRVFAEGMVTDYPLTLRHRSGALMEVLYNASVYRDRAGNVQGVFAAARDVTEQRQAAGYARSLIEASLDPLVTISAAGKVTDVNESTVRATGVPREQLVGTDFSEYFTDPDKAREGYRRVFAEGMVTDYPLTLRHRSGALMEVLYNASVYRDRAGNVLGVFAAARDVTARKRAEEELARRAAQLEIANRDLGRSNTDLEQFAYIASHDLAEPLRAISGPISLVARRYKGQIDDDADEFIGFAVDGCQRMQSLIDGLLAFSRVGRIEGVVAVVDADEVAQDAITALGPTLRNAGAEVTVGPLGHVIVERDQLSQVFQNLIGNAVKFVAPGVTPRITITAEDVDGLRRIDVVDNGIGIEPKYRAQIFSMFKRLHARDEYPGTGIGLAMVKKIVERHGGAVGVDVAPSGTGSRFWFTLPSEEENSR